MAFVIVSRTALVTMPIMVAVFGLLHLRWRVNLMIVGAVIAVGGLAWFASPQLEWTVKTFSRDYQLYKEGVPTSIARTSRILAQRAADSLPTRRWPVTAPARSRGSIEQADKQPGWIARRQGLPQSA